MRRSSAGCLSGEQAREIGAHRPAHAAWRTIAVRMSCPLRCGSRPRRVVLLRGNLHDLGVGSALKWPVPAGGGPNSLAAAGLGRRQQALGVAASHGKVELQLFVGAHENEFGLLRKIPSLSLRPSPAHLDVLFGRAGAGALCDQARREAPSSTQRLKSSWLGCSCGAGTRAHFGPCSSMRKPGRTKATGASLDEQGVRQRALQPSAAPATRRKPAGRPRPRPGRTALIERIDRAKREALLPQCHSERRPLRSKRARSVTASFSWLAALVSSRSRSTAAVRACLERAHQVPGIAALGELDGLAVARLDQAHATRRWGAAL